MKIHHSITFNVFVQNGFSFNQKNAIRFFLRYRGNQISKALIILKISLTAVPSPFIFFVPEALYEILCFPLFPVCCTPLFSCFITFFWSHFYIGIRERQVSGKKSLIAGVREDIYNRATVIFFLVYCVKQGMRKDRYQKLHSLYYVWLQGALRSRISHFGAGFHNNDK